MCSKLRIPVDLLQDSVVVVGTSDVIFASDGGDSLFSSDLARFVSWIDFSPAVLQVTSHSVATSVVQETRLPRQSSPSNRHSSHRRRPLPCRSCKYPTRSARQIEATPFVDLSFVSISKVR